MTAQLDTKGVADTLFDTISSLAWEIGRRVEIGVGTADWMTREIKDNARDVLLDYFLGQFKPTSYIIADGDVSITCVRCGMTSHNRNDVEQRYCGHCKRFHGDP